jgi:hypothetical protein
MKRRILVEVDERTIEKAKVAAEAQRMTLDAFIDFAIRYAAAVQEVHQPADN